VHPPEPPPDAELRAVFGGDAAGRRAVRLEQLYEPVASATSGIWRVATRGRSAVLKLVAHAEGDHPQWQSGDDVGHWYYWRREVDAYETGVLAGMPGHLRAPRCLHVATRADGSVALWLEDLGAATAAAWSLDRYGVAAFHLGTMQGAYLVDEPLPDRPWLSRGWLRAYLGQRDGDMDLARDPGSWRDPRVARWFPTPLADDVAAMRADQSSLLDALDALPRTLCHLDLHPANLFAGGDAATAAIDWSFVGIGALGEDAGNLVADAALDFHVPADRVDELDATITDGYVRGLRAAGWPGPADSARLGMVATMTAKYAWIAPAMVRAALDGRASLNRRPFADAAAAWAPTVRFLLRRADEARRMLGSSRR